MSLEFDRSWMWHPNFVETQADTAGLFVHFRRLLFIRDDPPKSLVIRITADTRYKLFANNRQVAFGPVKGDQSLWFFDEVDIAPYLNQGYNHIAVHVLRFFHATTYAPSFPRLPSGGLYISVPEVEGSWARQLESSTLWETVIDPFTVLRIDEPEDHFLHIYERASRSGSRELKWVPAKLLEYKNSTGNSTPWHLSPRLLPPLRIQKAHVSAIHNVTSSLPSELWRKYLVGNTGPDAELQGLLLPATTHHCIELEMSCHLTAFLRIRFQRPSASGGMLKITYSESYEDDPVSTPWVRQKGDRCDYRKRLIGPQDIYEFQGISDDGETLGYCENESSDTIVAPFHFRTFRFIKLEIDTGSSDLAFKDLDIETVNYPLEVTARFEVPEAFDKTLQANQLWATSIRTLVNCMHDCYEDCPFYEQLQYAMDTRSSSLFTYLISGDDRLARQAIVQLHNSFQARIGLTASRAPSHRPQFIPHFSLYWVSMVCDHLAYFGDKKFASRFVPVIDAILAYFDSRIGYYGLVACENRPGIWNFVDWTHAWKPHGIPPAIERSGISTFTNQLYAYTLSNAAGLLGILGRKGVAEEYRDRASNISASVKRHCFDGQFFLDTVAARATATDYSQHCQIWAVLSGAVTGVPAQQLLTKSLQRVDQGEFVKESISMSFYTLRALSVAGGDVYDKTFNSLWRPWHEQLSQNVTTWVEDDVSQRSDCHAWGSVPLYEFTVEVAGIRLAEPGWSAIAFQPRLGLFRQLKVTVPLGMVDGKPQGHISVSWSANSTGDTEVSLSLDLIKPGFIPVQVTLPGVKTLVNLGSQEWSITIKSKDINAYFE
ncbi:Six-hairpin glycosidase-like protein [Dactylonectria macrodidyma]|uniref:Six-hairpin glycosidase-like protein n=1 Tax=Dactylonectria macrodidyma TaxID=307937 RepID=A0A9P9IGU2_9HYPO|nr:Six-hairpin glycosidase-like protein [Dactylonectria macrodidyma]